GIAQREHDGWREVRVGAAGQDRFEEVLVPVELDVPFTVPSGARVPLPRGIREWGRACDAMVRRGFVVAIDYAVAADEFAERPWLRTYRAHAPGSDPLDDPGAQDITADVVLEQLRAAMPMPCVSDERQADWLRALGLDALVDEGRRAWAEGAHRGDLDALAGRSRVGEAEALTDPAGLGAHRVLLFAKEAAAGGFDWRVPTRR
ncbi:MAG TPA: SAM-dependent methyltransferase, partial [Acidimicrobiia bacterium]|nr:SAM-dependent methyltransferase [Acidimicrobiia bacterium]